MPRTAASGRVAAPSRAFVRDYGTSLFFDGVNDYLSWGNILLSLNTITVAFRFKLPTDGSSNFDVLFGYGNTRWYMILNGAAGSRRKLAFTINSGSTPKSTGYLTHNLDRGEFYTAIGTYDPNGGANNLTLRVYNRLGVLVETKTSTQTGNIDSTAQSLRAGHDPSRGFYVDMFGKDFRLYSRVLTVVEQDYLALGGEPSSAGLELWAKCDEGSGTTAIDSSSSSFGTRTGTITGATYSDDVMSKLRTVVT